MSKGSAPDPNAAAVAGLQEQLATYPQTYITGAQQQLGQGAFAGLGTADVQNLTQDQMAQQLLQIQQQYGPEYVAQALADLQQSDPQGYAAYNQAFQKIQSQANQPTPNLGLATSTQAGELSNLQGSQSLTPEELAQVQQGVRGQNIGSGIYLGNAPAQAEASGVVNATDQKNAEAQQASGAYLASGVSPADLQYQEIQQNLANYGAFINGQTPTAQFGQIGGAQGGAAPYSNTGYSTPTLNEGQGAAQGISQTYGLYGAQQQEANPYLAGLNFLSQGVGTAAAGGLFNGSSTVPQGNISGALGEFNGTSNLGVPTGNAGFDPNAFLPDTSGDFSGYG